MNPYWGSDFFSFFGILFHRIELFITMQGPSPLASDEVQMLLLGSIAISSGIVGSFLVVRKMTMLANSLSHTILIGIVGASLLFSDQGGSLSLFSLITASLFAAFGTVGVTRLIGKGAYVKEDASIGLGFTTLFALGLILLMLFTKNAHIGTEAIMGNLDAVHVDDLKLSFSLVLFNGIVFFLFYPLFKNIAFDRAYAVSRRLPCTWIDGLFFLLLAMTSVFSFRAVGVLLVLAFFTGPQLTARLFCDRLSRLIMFSIGIGLFIAAFSVAIARHFLSVYQMPLSTAGIAVTVIGCVFALSAFCKGKV